MNQQEYLRAEIERLKAIPTAKAKLRLRGAEARLNMMREVAITVGAKAERVKPFRHSGLNNDRIAVEALPSPTVEERTRATVTTLPSLRDDEWRQDLAARAQKIREGL